MVSAARRKLRIRDVGSEPKNNKNQTVKSRKRNRGDYQQVEDDIQFLVATKRPKLNIDDSSDDGSSKQSTPSPPTSNNDSNRPTRPFDPQPQPESNVSSESKVSDDTREFNRRSPNGFLLPDPLPRGEILTDTIKQEWVLGKPIGMGGFGELYLAAFKGPDGKISAEKYVIKVSLEMCKLTYQILTPILIFRSSHTAMAPSLSRSISISGQQKLRRLRSSRRPTDWPTSVFPSLLLTGHTLRRTTTTDSLLWRGSAPIFRGSWTTPRGIGSPPRLPAL